MTLSAVDCLHRGLVNLRANWELVLVQLLQSVTVGVLTVVGFVPPLAALGLTEANFFAASAAEWPNLLESLSEFTARGVDAWMLLLASLLVSFAIWLLACFVYCFFQGGIYGVLVAGDRQASSGKRRHWQWFRTFNTGDLRGWSVRYIWRYFWLLNLFLVLATLWMTLFAGLLLAAIAAGGRWGPQAALGIGCGGSLPAVFGLVVLGLWANLAQAEVAHLDSGVWSAMRNSLRVLGRRFGAVVVLSLLAMVVALTIGVFFAVVSTLAELAAHGFGAVLMVGQGVLAIGQMVASGLLTLAFAAALVALVRSEMARESVP
jgi:hypothetical protein